MMRASMLRMLWFACAVALSVAAIDNVDIPKEIPDEPFDIRAGRFEYTNQTFIASGGVTGTFENVTIKADHLSGNPQTGDLHAGGDIEFERDNILWRGSELDYNFITQAGNFGPSSLEFDPYVVSVGHVERVSTNEYLLQDAVFTTCPLERSHYHIHFKEARLVDEKYLIAKGATFYVGKVPVFHVPYWRQTLSRSIFSFDAGVRSEWGAYGLVKATVPVTENIDSITDVNLYSKRGVGFGQGFAWDYPLAKGEISGFYLHDQDPNKRFSNPSIEKDRYRFKFEHLQNFTDTNYLNTKWNYLSDSKVLDEYFQQEYRRYAQPENYASWVYGTPAIGSEFFVSERLNDFYDNTDRVEYSADLYRTRIAGTPFYFQSENSIAYLERVYANTNTLSNFDSVRIDSANTVYMPQRYGFVSLVPRASYRATYYSKTPSDGADEYRGIGGTGAEISMQATKVLSERERWYGKGLRHKIEPYADYTYERSSVDSSDLYQFDDVDRLDDSNRTKIGLRNVLQTKRDNRLARFIDVDLYTFYLGKQNGAEDDFSSLFLDARMPLTKRTMVDIEGEIDWNSGQVPFFDTRFTYNRDDLILSLEHLYRHSANQSLWTPRAEINPEGEWSAETYARYDDKSTDLEEIALIGYINRCCMRYGLGYHFYGENEHSLMFSIGLSALPQSMISSSF
jgi:lipopolysaccharide assembly outer membrane protein LptD (OstA)